MPPGADRPHRSPLLRHCPKPNPLHSYTDNLGLNLIMKGFYELKLNLRDFYGKLNLYQTGFIANGMIPFYNILTYIYPSLYITLYNIHYTNTIQKRL